MKALLIALMTWISGETGLPVPEPPALQIATPLQIHQQVHGPDSQPDDTMRALAYYERATGTIVMPPGEASDSVWLSMLVHELVHHQQWKSDRWGSYRCHGHLEREAYEAQAAFLALDNLDLHETIGLGPLLYFALISCPPAHEMTR